MLGHFHRGSNRVSVCNEWVGLVIDSLLLTLAAISRRWTRKTRVLTASWPLKRPKNWESLALSNLPIWCVSFSIPSHPMFVPLPFKFSLDGIAFALHFYFVHWFSFDFGTCKPSGGVWQGDWLDVVGWIKSRWDVWRHVCLFVFCLFVRCFWRCRISWRWWRTCTSWGPTSPVRKCLWCSWAAIRKSHRTPRRRTWAEATTAP